jgi:PAS domain S-box-containing protein
MDVIIYSFFIVSALAGISYYVVKQRYSRLLQEEQEKYFSLRNNELQLLSEQQKLESLLKEKEHQIAEIRSRISSEEIKTTSLGSEVITKDKQIQSLTAQLQHETQQRTSLQQELASIEHQLKVFKQSAEQDEAHALTLKNEIAAKEQALRALSDQLLQETEQKDALRQEIGAIEGTLSEFKAKAAEEETKTLTLSSDVSVKDETIRTLSSELHQLTEVRSHVEQVLSQKEEEAALLASRIREEEEKRSALMNELSTTEQQLRSELEQRNAELQRTLAALQQESELRTSNETRAQETIQELQHQVEQLQNELGSTRSANEVLNSSREQLGSEFTSKESEYRQKLSDMEELYSMLQADMDKTAEQLRDQIRIRETSEQALQESKQKLYAVIAELEQKYADQANAIAALQSELSVKSNDLDLAEQSIHNILRLVPLPVFVVNENGSCEYCNDPLKELVGYGLDELSNKHFSHLFPQEDRAFYEEQWKSSMNRSEQFQGETRILTAAGDAVPASVNFVDLRPNGEMTKYVGFIVDRTTEKDAKRHYTAAKEREQELLDLKSRFIGMVSNQLRTSLVTMATNTELLERFIDKWSDERRYHSFLRINESIRQMLELVRDVTFTTKATTEQYTLAISPVDLESLFQSAARELTADLESHHHFILSEQGNISSVSLDEKLLKTIIAQLLSNAFKYSRDNTEVNAHIELVNSSCIIKISDQGIGIPAAEQKHLFSSFFRASNVSNIYGTGLGLTIAQQCVQMHGGSITINSELNKGTTVTVSLPVSHNN